MHEVLLLILCELAKELVALLLVARTGNALPFIHDDQGRDLPEVLYQPK